jgi:peptidoglycan/xylan/chitin deacetylase (PgdA/CDA1 family)
VKRSGNLLAFAYERLHERSPKSLKCLLSRAVFSLADKPSAMPPAGLTTLPFGNSYKGGLVISADFELAWGWRYSKQHEDPVKMAGRARANMPMLLKIFDESRIPVTWATVGHLLLRACRRRSHSWMKRIPYFDNRKWLYDKGDWFEHDPCTSWDRAREWYAPDLIDKILNAVVEHEIGCHTFSHIDMSYENCPRGVAEDEVQACLEAAKEWGLKLESFVFAGGTYGNYEVLRKYGFTNYRKALNHALAYPHLDRHGLVVLPSSVGLDDNGCGWSRAYQLRRFMKYIHRAVTTRTVCHFWFHPSMEPWFMYSILPPLMRYAAELRDKGQLWIGTMRAAATMVAPSLNKG